MVVLYVSYLYTCSYKCCHSIICLIFRPQQHVANPRVPVPFTAVWRNLPQHINKSEFFPAHQTHTQDHVVHHGRHFTISLVSSDPIFMKCLPEDSNCDQSTPQKSVLISISCSKSSTGRNHFKFMVPILGSIRSNIWREALILFDVSTAENLSTKSPIDQYSSSSIRAGGVGQIAHCNLLSAHLTRRERPADDLSSWRQSSWVIGHALGGNAELLQTPVLPIYLWLLNLRRLGGFQYPQLRCQMWSSSLLMGQLILSFLLSSWCSKTTFCSVVVLTVNYHWKYWSVVGTFPVSV